MTIDEKYNNAIQMFRSYYDSKNETLRIKSSVLKENDFGEDFWSMLCPRLEREGILKERISFFHGIERIHTFVVDGRKLIAEYEKYALKFKGADDNQKTQVPIKNVRLDEQNYFLVINDGDRIISFKSKKSGEGLDKEKKLWKILYHLWDFRWERKGDRITKRGEYATLGNLATASTSASMGAVSKSIQRLNKRFQKGGVSMCVETENEKCRLIIDKA